MKLNDLQKAINSMKDNYGDANPEVKIRFDNGACTSDLADVYFEASKGTTILVLDEENTNDVE